MIRLRARLAIASTLTAAVAVTGAAASAEASPGTTARVTKATTTKATTTKATTTAAAAAARRLAAARQEVLRQIAAADAALVRESGLVGRAALGADTTAAVLANIAADRAALLALRTAVSSATSLTAVQRVGAAVTTLRPQNYSQVRAVLALDHRTLTAVAAQADRVTEVAAAADAREDEGADVSAVRAALGGAAALNRQAAAAAEASVAAALTVRAATGRSVDAALRVARDRATAATEALAEAELHLGEALAALDAAVVPAPPATEPGPTEPALAETGDGA